MKKQNTNKEGLTLQQVLDTNKKIKQEQRRVQAKLIKKERTKEIILSTIVGAFIVLATVMLLNNMAKEPTKQECEWNNRYSHPNHIEKVCNQYKAAK